MTNIGLGCPHFKVAVYLANTPQTAYYQSLDRLSPVVTDEIHAIALQCGNGWRKVFNVYAKLLYALNSEDFSFSQQAPTWQAYRDNFLLQTASKTALLFSAPILAAQTDSIHIICGRTYAKSLLASGELQVELTWLDNEFAISKQHRVVVCPYFDYRQLSNSKVERLSLLLSLLTDTDIMREKENGKA